MKTCVFIAVVVVVGLSGGRFPDEKACCLSSKTRQKNVCSGRMTGLSTEMALVKEVDWEVDRGNFVWWNAHAQSFDRCEPSRVLSKRSAGSGDHSVTALIDWSFTEKRTFSCLKVTFLLVSTKNRDLWNDNAGSPRFTVTLRLLRV